MPYRETITRSNSDMHRHKKQTGGAGQFGEVHMRVEPNPESDYEFADEVVGMALSHSYMPSIEKGIKSVMEQGVVAGYPVVERQDCRVRRQGAPGRTRSLSPSRSPGVKPSRRLCAGPGR